LILLGLAWMMGINKKYALSPMNGELP
jgi:hypothetical protein